MPRAAVVRGSALFRNLKQHIFLSQAPDKFYHGGKPNVQTDTFVHQSVISGGIVSSPFAPISIPEMGLVEYIWKDTAKWDEKEIITCSISGRSYTYGVAKHLINQCAQGLLSQCGLKPGDVVAMYLPNIPEYAIISHGVLSAGLTLTSVNPLFTLDELARQFKSAGVKAIVTISLFLENALKITPQLPGYQTTLCMDAEDDPIKNIKSIPKLILGGHKAELPKIENQSVALLPYSSGTTGLPKGVQLTHYNLIANLVQGDHPELANLTEDERFRKGLTVIPFFHIYGYNSIMNSAILEGLHMVTLPKFTPEDYIKALIEHRPYFILVVPSLLIFLASHPSVTREHLASVNYIVSGAAPATEELQQKFREKAGRNVRLRQGYGLTESSPVLIMTPRSMPSSKKNSTGVLFPSTEAKVVDITTLEVLGPNQPGELWARGPQVMSGYLNNEKATEEIFSDGWLRTGDVVYYDEDGYFYVVDRCKDLIKVKGNQVSPTELENLIIELPGIADVAVIGIPDVQAGELPCAFIVKRKDATVTEEEINSYVNPKVAPYKRLAGGIKFITAIPRNPSGKILRNELKSMQ